MLRVGFSFIPVPRYPDSASGVLPLPFSPFWGGEKRAAPTKSTVGRDFRLQDNVFADFAANGSLTENA